YFAISRRREYLADASAARLTRYPEGLASALENISHSTEDLSRANRATAPLYIVNPLKKAGRALSNLTSTHPPITERIKILRAMAGGAGLMNYQKAFNRVHGKKSDLIPPSGLKESGVPVRPPSSTAAAGAGGRAQKRELGDLLRAVNRYAFLTCVACGLKIKTPPDLKKEAFPCPRCDHEVNVPAAGLATAAAVLEGVQEATKTRSPGARAQESPVYQRKGKGWETFSCTCGRALQLSPSFGASHITCSKCGRRIMVKR
ncbi:MAG: M48 family metalloprotease, partial [Planctomycetota bacterium]